MAHTKGPWVLTNIDDEYRDFEQWLPDNETGVGGVLRITFIDRPGEPPAAYGSILWNSEDGEEIGVSDFTLTRQQAERIVGGSMLAHQVLAKAKGGA